MCRLLRLAVWVSLSNAIAGEAMCQQLLLIGKQPAQADALVAVTEDGFTFQQGDGEFDVSAEEIVRWSNPTIKLRQIELALTCGSRFVLEQSWGSAPSIQLEGETVSILTREFGRLKIPLDHVRAVVFRAPNDLARRSDLWDKILTEEDDMTALHLANGDVLRGEVLSIHSSKQESSQITLQTLLSEQPLSIHTDLVAAISWGGRRVSSETQFMAVGLRRGSYLMVKHLRQSNKRIAFELHSGHKLTVTADQIVHLQRLGNQLQYLSDTEPKNYHHQPYLQFTRPLRQDRNALGKPFVVEGNLYTKGLGMPTAAQVVYHVPPGSHRFTAQIALDAAAYPAGSVEFRVHLLKGSRWVEAFKSETITPADPPQPIAVDLRGAEQIRLETHYAERGDQQDFANWLDARFE